MLRVRDVGEKKCQDVSQRYEDEKKSVKKQYNSNMDVSLAKSQREKALKSIINGKASFCFIFVKNIFILYTFLSSM